jgi:YfiH family protein
VRAVSTTRLGGASRGPWQSFNLAHHVGDDRAAVDANRRRLRELLALPSEPVWLEQVHGTHVAEALGSPAGTRADGAVARGPGVVCAVMTADCLPLLLCNDAGSEVAALHVGWRGLADGVIEAGVASMSTPPARLMAWLGPAIGPDAFEVGEEVRARLGADGDTARPSTNGGRWLVDLYALARRRLKAAGVTTVRGGGFCTLSDRARFFSYRRDRRCGRMATLVWLTRRV